MNKKKAVVVRKDFLANSDTGIYYIVTTKKQNNLTIVNVKGTADEINFTFSFKDKNELIKIASEVMVETVKLDRKVRTAINELQ